MLTIRKKLIISSLVLIFLIIARQVLSTEVLSNRTRLVTPLTHIIYNTTDHVLPMQALPNLTLEDLAISSCDLNLLHGQCDSSVPQFVTFANTHIGRWSKADLKNGLKLMYSSLVRAHNCRVVLHVYCDSLSLMTVLEHINTTMGTSSNITAYFLSVEDNAYTNPWLRLSRHKLNIMSKHIRSGSRVVWIDVDTLIFTDLREAFELSSTWVIGWQNGNKNRNKHVKISGVSIPPVFDAQGDLWSVDSDAIEEVVALEKSLKVKPRYDLQGYFSILLARGSSRFRLLTDVMKNYTFGFQCSNYEHPTTSNFEPLIIDNQIHCRDRQDVGTSTRVGSISFTAPTFRRMFLSQPSDISEMSQVTNRRARNWLIHYFHCRSTV
jgi:hypothetical protein